VEREGDGKWTSKQPPSPEKHENERAGALFGAWHSTSTSTIQSTHPPHAPATRTRCLWRGIHWLAVAMGRASSSGSGKGVSNGGKDRAIYLPTYLAIYHLAFH
jgi:hypothetical protein